MTQHVCLDPAMVDRYLSSLAHVTPTCKAAYGSVLRQWQSFMASQTGEPLVSVESLSHWLRARASSWSLAMLCHRLRIVDRFLDWLVHMGHLSRNPLADLQHTYGRHQRRAIVGALLHVDPLQTLQSLRPLRRFGSHLGAVMQNHLQRMRALGYRYEREEQHLIRLT